MPYMPSLSQLQQPDAFLRRHLGPDQGEQQAMLDALGLSSREQLIEQTVPPAIRLQAELNLPPALDEQAALAKLRSYAEQNQLWTSLIGMGYHGTITPPVILRNVLENPGWYTAYTPYQPEIAQGRLEALLNYQQMIIDLTGLDLANASLLDEGTAAAEAMTLARRMAKSKSNRFFVEENCHPQTLSVVQTRAEAFGFELVVGTLDELAGQEVFGALLQYPDTHGEIRDLRPAIEQLHAQQALACVAADLLSLLLLTPPGELGADVVLGSTQRFGVPMGYGGPHAAYFASRDEFKRGMPGRIIGVSKDARGNTALRMALQTREQHIRREKATSNICTAQALLAITASMYAVYHGPQGLRAIAERTHAHARTLAAALTAAGIELASDSFFDTVVARVPDRADAVVAAAADAGINLRRIDADSVGVSADETTTAETIAVVARAFDATVAEATVIHPGEPGFNPALVRTSDYLTHPIFHSVRSETQMLRYLRRLADRDLALDRTMIPLGSCTMKLNSTAEMESISWPEFAGIHPYVPAEQSVGWRDLIADLEARLIEITGYAGISLQPNAGSQGEYAGLLAIRRYHLSKGDAARDICLIPASAHGTNAASAVLAGMRVVVVKNTEDGHIDMVDLDAKLAAHGEELSAIMLTYPSTYGVYDADVREVCDKVHAAGGQVYIDGANMNALVGLAQPGKFGGDVSHLNLHKTFAIPHGGGGPGVGPVAVAQHLLPYLPGDPTGDFATADGGVPVVATLFGSAGVLPISYAYIAMMGGDGLTLATKAALLSANYIAARLADHFPVLFTGNQGLVAHECILDLRELTAKSGVTAEDVAKRLIDFGFHAPTLAFPVADTLMVEPTESEDLVEIERFIEAMIAIRGEIDTVIAGEIPLAESPLRLAPHTAAAVVSDEWSRPYTREQAAFPVDRLRQDKYFPPVGRIDGAFGDRNLVCACPAPEAFEI